ncbi:hypothetical protein [Ottowia thiooxydans]|uniref:hypothetical protein n=1 Tax=Ottowia thiooxydans TaxID=219182 RepID=UPI0003F5C095|nr:hypothetical protein [Ottowia thiooxydans]
MSNVVNHPGLKAILLLDAAIGVVVAALQLAAPQLLSSWLGLAVPLLVGSAVLLLGYVALLLGMAFASHFKRWVLHLLVWGNVSWGIACLALAAGLSSATKLGIAYLLIQAFTVFAFSAWEWHLAREGRAQLVAV